ncbi:sensor histidine kinase [Paenibacillus septentrionalis]|uniref:histidine kinase n=1 Tax=Paenibacillus septentrionalis TaxID=429342 RepID=A0ABW1V6W4_9BACL
MVLLLAVVIFVQLVIIVLLYASRRKTARQLNDIVTKLSDIVEHETSEKLLLHTDHETIRRLLNEINRLLDYNQKVIADYARAKTSLRKMMSNMSHDMKTPLTVVLGYVEKLKLDHTMSHQERQAVIDRLHLKTESVIALLNQFFELVKLESEDYRLPMRKVCISELCRMHLLEYYELLQAKGLQVKVEIPEDNYYIMGNEDALQRILSNLISNSLRYGSDGGVFGFAVREIGDHIAIDVWDKGRGIDEVHHDRVFERLYTLDDARNPKFQGSGLGLSITKHLTEAMNGTIHLSSVPYEQTMFTCRFRRISY